MTSLAAHKAKMARPVRERSTSRPQQEGAEEPEQDPQQDGQPDVAEGEDLADYNPDVDYVGSEPKVESVAQDERILMQNMQKWIFPMKGPSARG